MGELQPTLSELMAKNRAVEEEQRKVQLEREKMKLPAPTPTTLEGIASQPETLARIKGKLSGTVEKMRVEEQRVLVDKVQHAEVVLQGARTNLNSTLKEYNENNRWYCGISRLTGYTATLKEQADKETNWVTTCEKQLDFLRKQVGGQKDPSIRQPGLALYEAAEKLEREGKTSEALELYRQASVLIGVSPDAQQEAVEKAGSNIRSMNQDGVKKYMKDLQESNARLDGVVSSCKTWEGRIKMAAAIVVIAPTFVLSIPAGLAVGLIGSAAYGLAHLYGQHVKMGRDFNEALKEAWSETVDLATMVVKNAAGGALFKGVGAVFGVLGQGPLRLLANSGAGLWKSVRAVFMLPTTLKAGGVGLLNVCKSGVNAVRGAPSAAWTNTKYFFNFKNSSALKFFGLVPKNPSALVGPGEYVAKATWGGMFKEKISGVMHAVCVAPKYLIVKPIQGILHPIRSIQALSKLSWDVATFPVRQTWAGIKTAGEFVAKDFKWKGASWLDIGRSFSRGHIAQYFTGMVLPSAPRAATTGASAFLTGGAVSAVEEVVRVRTNNIDFPEFLKKKYGPKFTLEEFNQFDPKDQALERDEWQASTRTNLRNILYTAGINGVTTALAAVIRVKKPPMSTAEKAAFTKASDEALAVSRRLQTSPTTRDAVREIKTFEATIKRDLGRYDTRPVERDLNFIKREVYRAASTAPTLPPTARPGVQDLERVARDFASRIPSNAYRNLAATVIPTAVHAHLTYLKNISDPNLRPGESTYSMQDLTNGLFYTMGGIKFGEGYTAGFNKALALSPADKITFRKARVDKIVDSKDPTKTINKKVDEIAVEFRAKRPLPDKIKMMRTGEGKAVLGELGSELGTDAVKGLALYGAYRGVEAANPNAIPWLIKKLTGFDPLWLTEQAGSMGRSAMGNYQLFKVGDYQNRHLRTKSINEMFEMAANANGSSLKVYDKFEGGVFAPRISGLVLPSADATASSPKVGSGSTAPRP